VIIEIKGASDGDAEIDVDFDKWERIISENPNCKVTIEFGGNPTINGLLPNQTITKGDGKYYHFLITEGAK
jgi:hypothetical protein